MQNRKPPWSFRINKIGDAAGDLLALINPFSRFSKRYLHNSSFFYGSYYIMAYTKVLSLLLNIYDDYILNNGSY